MLLKIKKNQFSKRIKKALWGHTLIKGKNFNLRYYFYLLNKEYFNRKKKGLKYEEKKKFVYNKRLTKYGKILLSRKKLCNFYYLNLRQFKHFCELSENNNNNNFYNNLVSFLERRLVTMIYRMNFVFSILDGYNKIKSGFFLVNKKLILNPNYIVQVGDIIEVNSIYKQLVFNSLLLRCNNSIMQQEKKNYFNYISRKNKVNYRIKRYKNKREKRFNSKKVRGLIFLQKLRKYWGTYNPRYLKYMKRRILSKRKCRFNIFLPKKFAYKLKYKIKNGINALYIRTFSKYNNAYGKKFKYNFNLGLYSKYRKYKFFSSRISAKNKSTRRKSSRNIRQSVVRYKSFRHLLFKKKRFFSRSRKFKSKIKTRFIAKSNRSRGNLWRTMAWMDNILVVYNRFNRRLFQRIIKRPIKLYKRDFVFKKYKHLKYICLKYFYLNLKIKSIVYDIYLYNKKNNYKFFKKFKLFKIFKKSYLYPLLISSIRKMLLNEWKNKLNFYINISHNLSFRFIRKKKKNKKFKYCKYFGKIYLHKQQNYLKYLNYKTRNLVKMKALLRAGTQKILRNLRVQAPLNYKMKLIHNRLRPNYWIMNNYPKYVFVNYKLLMGCLIKEPEIYEVYYPFKLKFFKQRNRNKEISTLLNKYKKRKNYLQEITTSFIKNLYIKKSYKFCNKKILRNQYKNKKNYSIQNKFFKNYIKKKNNLIYTRNFSKSYQYKFLFNFLKRKYIKNLIKREKAFLGAGYFNRFF